MFHAASDITCKSQLLINCPKQTSNKMHIPDIPMQNHAVSRTFGSCEHWVNCLVFTERKNKSMVLKLCPGVLQHV